MIVNVESAQEGNMALPNEKITGGKAATVIKPGTIVMSAELGGQRYEASGFQAQTETPVVEEKRMCHK